MEVQDIIMNLCNNHTPVKKIKEFSKLPGIYAFFFIGTNFPLSDFVIPKHKIVYIGKTESSQQARNCNVHFKSGKTGSSTVRKSIGALLSQTINIKPIIRSLSDVNNNRISHYKFDDQSEDIVTQWMFENLSVAFYEYPKSKKEIDTLETLLINDICPVLNIDHKNKNNPFRNKIKELRKKLGIIAHANLIQEDNQQIDIELENIIAGSKITTDNNLKSGKYFDVWKVYSKEIQILLNSRKKESSIQLDSNLFKQVGNRKSYSFTLQYNNNEVANNISSSAVARDLHAFLSYKNYNVGNNTFKLTKDFKLQIRG